jgi:hypothetical protein
MSVKKIYCFSLFLFFFAEVIFATVDYSKLEGFGVEQKKIVTMNEKLLMKEEAKEMMRDILKEDPINPFNHYYQGILLFDTDLIINGDDKEFMFKSFERACLLNDAYKSTLSNYLGSLANNPVSILYFCFDKEDILRLLEISGSYSSEIFNGFNNMISKNSSLFYEKKKPVNEYVLRVIEAYVSCVLSEKFNDIKIISELYGLIGKYLNNMNSTNDAVLMTLIVAQNSQLFELKNLKNSAGLLLSLIDEKDKRLYMNAYEQYMSEDLEDKFIESGYNYRVVGLQMNSFRMSLKENRDIEEYHDRKNGKLIFRVQNEEFYNERIVFFSDIGNYDYMPYYVHNYLNIMDVKESKKRMIGRNKLIYDMYYLHRTPENIERFTKMEDDELLKWVRGNVKPGLPDELKAQ